MHQGRVDLERLLQLFNTHGTEIAPGSDVVGENLQCDRLVHSAVLLSSRHPRRSGGPERQHPTPPPWIPAFAGKTGLSFQSVRPPSTMMVWPVIIAPAAHRK